MKEKKRSRLGKVPATILGIILGLLVGGLRAAKDLVEKKSPVLGLVIVIITPVAVFAFEQFSRIFFPIAYRKKIAGTIYFWWRWLLNESFSLRFLYQLRFPGDKKLDAHIVREALDAAPGKELSYGALGKNYIHLQYSKVRDYIVVTWDTEEANDDMADGVGISTHVFKITLEPAVQVMVMRNAPEQLEFLENRVNDIRNKLLTRIQSPQNTYEPDDFVIADAWFGACEPSKKPELINEIDPICEANVRGGIGWVQLTGKTSSILLAVYRWVKILEPPTN